MKLFKRKLYILVALLLVVTLLLESVNVYLSNKLSSESIYAQEIRDEIASLEEKNTLMKSELLGYTSYDVLASRAAELGFVEPKNSISLYTPLEVAVR